MAANLACHLTGLAETFYFSLEPETRQNFDPLIKALKERFFSDDLKWRLRQSLISRQQGPHESLDSDIEFIDTTCRRLGVSREDQFYYFDNGLRADIKREVLMHQPKDYLIAVNFARRTEFVDRTIADSRSNLNNCKKNPVYTLPRDKLRQDLTDEIKFFKGWCSPNLQIVIGILKLQRSLSPSLCRVHISGPHLLQMWRSRPQSAYLSKSVA